MYNLSHFLLYRDMNAYIEYTSDIRKCLECRVSRGCEEKRTMSLLLASELTNTALDIPQVL